MTKFPVRKVYSVILTLAVLSAGVASCHKADLVAFATTSGEYQNRMDQTQTQIDATQAELDAIRARIGSYEEQEEILEEQLDDVNAEVINTMTEINLKEEEIATMQELLEVKEGEITAKQADIEATEKEYEAAQAREEKQHDDMILRIRAMYEQNTGTILDLVMQGHGLQDFLNRLDYVESIYEYDNQKLTEYAETKEAVYQLGLQLAAEKEVLEGEQAQLEMQKSELEAEKRLLEDSKTQLASLKAKLQAQTADYEALIKKANQEAAVATAQLKKEKAQLATLKAARDAAAKAEQAATNGTSTTSTGTTKASATGTYTSNYNSVIDSASGSELGKTIAKYGCQFIGNPYVAGGTSLTNGADCSGFTYRIYADFGYTIPRTSYLQRSAGTGVEYANAQPGDLICYDGHVAMYIGGGLIVHASSAKTGIKIGNAAYRTILAVRRIIN
jgi:cell wall-associated NlpC family hydrolase